MSTDRPSLWKQVTGALAGAALAVGGYMSYQYGSDAVRAYLIPPGFDEEHLPRGGIRLSDAEPTDREERLHAKAKEAVARMRELQQQTVAQASSAPAPMAEMSSASSSAEAMVAMADPLADVESAPMGELPGGHAAAVLIRKEQRLAAMVGSDAAPAALPSSGPGMLVAAAGAVAGAVASRRRAHSRS